MSDVRSKEISGVYVKYRVMEGGDPSRWELSYENSAFQLEIKDGEATFSFLNSVTEDEAIRRTNEFLKSWVGDRILQTGESPREFQLEAWGNPAHRVKRLMRVTGTVSGAWAEENARRDTPWRRHEFHDNPTLRPLIDRYQGARQGRDNIQVVAYVCLTALQDHFGDGGVRGACSISTNVLSTFRRLSTRIGTYSTARKVESGHEFRDLTEKERHWLESAVRELLFRAGTVIQSGELRDTLTLSDLPPL